MLIEIFHFEFNSQPTLSKLKAMNDSDLEKTVFNFAHELYEKRWKSIEQKLPTFIQKCDSEAIFELILLWNTLISTAFAKCKQISFAAFQLKSNAYFEK